MMDLGWAITPAALEAILEIAARESDWVKTGQINADTFKLFHKYALQSQGGEYLQGTQRTQLINGVAVLPLYGPMYPRANMMTDYSGATSTETFAHDFKVAMESREVHSILFDVDSPGGAVTGISELSDIIYNARGVKPIESFVGGIGASAALWVMSSADKTTVSNTAEIGSVGVVAAFKDTKSRDEKAGVRTIEIVSSVSPFKRVGIDTEEGKAKIQRLVDATAEVFVENLARNRGVDRDTVLNKFGQGDMFVGAQCVAQGLADRVGTFDAVLTEMIAENKNRKWKGVGMTKISQTATGNEVSGQADEGIAKAVEAAKLEGIQAEQTRVKAIKALPHKGMEAFVEAHMYDDGMTAEKMAVEILKEQEKVRGAQASSIVAEGQKLAQQTQNIGGAPAGTQADADDAAMKRLSSAMAAGMNQKR
jgi:ClpP class serine protease